MKRALLIIVGALALGLVIRALWFGTGSHESGKTSPAADSSAAPSSPVAPGREGAGDEAPGTDGRTAPDGSAVEAYAPGPDPLVGRTADGKTVLNEPFALSRQLHAPGEGAEEDVQILEQVFWYYRKVFGENPVASQNSDVIAALTGNNPRGIVVFDPRHPSIDAEGRLLDRWGTPYEFHALTEKKLDVWSAGGDGKFGTPDDVKLGLEEEGLQLQAE